jgi:hypothetical protein
MFVTKGGAIVRSELQPGTGVTNSARLLRGFPHASRLSPLFESTGSIHDFQIGRALSGPPVLPEIGFAANRHLLRVESLRHDHLIEEATLAARKLDSNTQNSPAQDF